MKGRELIGKAAHNLVRNRTSVRDIYKFIRVPKEVVQNMPKATVNPFRKRPVAVTYDKDQYYRFLMPSQKSFLFSGLDVEDVLGTRRNRTYSPQIKFQQRLDSILFCSIIGMSVLMMAFTLPTLSHHMGLRENLFYVNHAKLTIDDFI